MALLSPAGQNPVLELLNNPLLQAGASFLNSANQNRGFGEGVLRASLASSQAQDSLLRRSAVNSRLEEMARLSRQRRLREAGMARVRELLPQFQNDPVTKALAEIPGFENMVAQAAIQRAFTPPQQTALVQAAIAAGLQPGTPEFQAFIREATLKPGTQLTVNNVQPEKPLGVTGALNFVNAKGEHPSPAVTPTEALNANFNLASTAQQKRAASSSGALAFIDQLEQLAFDPQNPLFKPFEGITGRGKLGISNAQALASQSNPNLTLFNDLSQSGLSIVVRAMGEVGTLNEGDISRIKNALPQVSPFPDTPEVARRKLNTLRSIIQDVSGRKPTESKRAVVGSRVLRGKTFIQFSDGTWKEVQ